MLNDSERSNPEIDIDLIKEFERLIIEMRLINPERTRDNFDIQNDTSGQETYRS